MYKYKVYDSQLNFRCSFISFIELFFCVIFNIREKKTHKNEVSKKRHCASLNDDWCEHPLSLHPHTKTRKERWIKNRTMKYFYERNIIRSFVLNMGSFFFIKLRFLYSKTLLLWYFVNYSQINTMLNVIWTKKCTIYFIP